MGFLLLRVGLTYVEFCIIVFSHLAKNRKVTKRSGLNETNALWVGVVAWKVAEWTQAKSAESQVSSGDRCCVAVVYVSEKRSLTCSALSTDVRRRQHFSLQGDISRHSIHCWEAIHVPETFGNPLSPLLADTHVLACSWGDKELIKRRHGCQHVSLDVVTTWETFDKCLSLNWAGRLIFDYSIL